MPRRLNSTGHDNERIDEISAVVFGRIYTNHNDVINVVNSNDYSKLDANIERSSLKSLFMTISLIVN